MKIFIKSNKKHGSEIKIRGKITRKKKKITKKYANRIKKLTFFYNIKTNSYLTLYYRFV